MKMCTKTCFLLFNYTHTHTWTCVFDPTFGTDLKTITHLFFWIQNVVCITDTRKNPKKFDYYLYSLCCKFHFTLIHFKIFCFVKAVMVYAALFWIFVRHVLFYHSMPIHWNCKFWHKNVAQKLMFCWSVFFSSPNILVVFNVFFWCCLVFISMQCLHASNDVQLSELCN